MTKWEVRSASSLRASRAGGVPSASDFDAGCRGAAFCTSFCSFWVCWRNSSPGCRVVRMCSAAVWASRDQPSRSSVSRAPTLLVCFAFGLLDFRAHFLSHATRFLQGKLHLRLELRHLVAHLGQVEWVFGVEIRSLETLFEDPPESLRSAGAGSASARAFADHARRSRSRWWWSEWRG